MPLEMLLTLVVGGIAGIAILLHLTGRSEQAVLTAANARAHWQRHFPGEHVSAVIAAASGHAALVITGTGPGVLWSFGADTVGRHLNGADRQKVPAGLHFSFGDFGAPGVTLELTEDEASQWLALIEEAAQTT